MVFLPADAPEPQEAADNNNIDDDATDVTILPTLEEVLACQFSSWYPLFAALPQKYRGRSNVTIKSVILDLPEHFVDYLNSDRLILPLGTRTSSALLEHHNAPEWSSDDDNDDMDDINDHEPQFAFPELDQAIDHALKSTLGGEALTPKLNWSAPRDAVWVNAGTLECRTAGDVYLLLKASDFCAHDVHHALQDVRMTTTTVTEHEKPVEVVVSNSNGNNNTNNHHEVTTTTTTTTTTLRPKLQLALRKWCNLYPSQEFRCFVCQGQLLAISQRHDSQHWPHLVERQDEIAQLLQHFYETAVRTIFMEHPMNRYVMDVYVDRKQRVWLIDINVWASRTDALLFTWKELTRLAALAKENDDNDNDSLPLMRVVETAKQVRADPLASYKAPIDTLHMASNISSSNGVGSDGENARFRDFMSLCHRPGSFHADDSGNSTSDDDE